MSENYIRLLKEAQEEIWNKGNVDLIEKYYSKNCVVHAPGSDIVGLDVTCSLFFVPKHEGKSHAVFAINS